MPSFVALPGGKWLVLLDSPELPPGPPGPPGPAGPAGPQGEPGNYDDIGLALLQHVEALHIPLAAHSPTNDPEPVPEPFPSGRDPVHLSEFHDIQDAFKRIPAEKALILPGNGAEYVLSGGAFYSPPSSIDIVFEPGAVIRQQQWNQSIFRTPGLHEVNFHFNGAEAWIAYPLDAAGNRITHDSAGNRINRGGGNVIRPKGADEKTVRMQHIGVYGLTVKQGPGMSLNMLADDVKIHDYRNEDFLRDQSTNIDDGLDIIGSRFEVIRFFIATHDDSIAIKSYGNRADDILIRDGVMIGTDVGLAFGSDIVRDIHNVRIENVRFGDALGDCGIPVNFKNYNSFRDANGDPRSIGEVYDVLFDGLTIEGTSHRYVDFLTTEDHRYFTCHDIEFQNVDVSRARLSDRLGYGQAVLHADRQGPNLNGLGAIA